MRWLAPVVVVTSLALMGWAWSPLATAPVATVLEPMGVAEVRDPAFDRIDAVLAARAPGWGLELRHHVATAISQESTRAGFDPLFVLAVIAVESEFQAQAVSVMGARGLMQVRPTTLYFMAEREGVRLSREEIDADPALSVRLGVRYLKWMKDSFRGDLDLALMAYNGGPTRLFQSLKERNLEPFRNYVRAVHVEYARLKVAHGESDNWALAARDTQAAVATP